MNNFTCFLGLSMRIQTDNGIKMLLDINPSNPLLYCFSKGKIVQVDPSRFKVKKSILFRIAGSMKHDVLFVNKELVIDQVVKYSDDYQPIKIIKKIKPKTITETITPEDRDRYGFIVNIKEKPIFQYSSDFHCASFVDKGDILDGIPMPMTKCIKLSVEYDLLEIYKDIIVSKDEKLTLFVLIEGKYPLIVN